MSLIAESPSAPAPKPRISSFVREYPRYDRMFSDVLLELLQLANPQRGERAFDVGCGAGTTTLALARKMGESSAVVGVDNDPVAVELARQRAHWAELSQVSFQVADAASATLDRAQLIVSRFGSLHFPDPLAGYRNLARALGPDGRLCFTAAREPRRNLWFALPMAAVQRELGVSHDADGKGAFALSDGERLRALLSAAGFRCELESLDIPVCVGLDQDDALEFFFETDGARLADRLDAPRVSRLQRVLSDNLAPYANERGVWLPGSFWLVRAEPIG